MEMCNVYINCYELQNDKAKIVTLSYISNYFLVFIYVVVALNSFYIIHIEYPLV